MKGRFRARGVTAALGTSSNGNPQIGVELTILDGEYQGASITWYGSFTDAATPYTLEALDNLGWTGDDLSNLTGIDRNEVSIVVDEEEYEGEVRDKVKYINKPGGLAMKNAMSEGQQKAFAASMKGAVLAHRQASGGAAKPPPKSNGGKEGFAPGGKARF